MLAPLRRRIGVRGTVLASIGVVWACYGTSIFVAPDRLAANPAAVWVVAFVPPLVWAAAWVGVGLVALVGAFARRPAQDAWPFALAAMLPASWVFLIAAVADLRVVPTMLMFVGFTLWAFSCAGIPERTD